MHVSNPNSLLRLTQMSKNKEYYKREEVENYKAPNEKENSNNTHSSMANPTKAKNQ